MNDTWYPCAYLNQYSPSVTSRNRRWNRRKALALSSLIGTLLKKLFPGSLYLTAPPSPSVGIVADVVARTPVTRPDPICPTTRSGNAKTPKMRGRIKEEFIVRIV